MITLRLLLALAVFFIVQTTAAKHLRRSLQSESSEENEVSDSSEEDDEFECDFVLAHMRYDDGTSDEWNACVAQDDHVIYDLSKDLLDEHKGNLHSGQTRLKISGARRRKSHDTQHGDEITARSAPTVQIVPQGRATGNIVIKTIGTSKAIVVRITSKDSNVTITTDALRSSVFEAQVNVALQMERCSAGKLKLVPAQGNGIQGGVAELFIDESTLGVKPSNLHGVIRDAFEAQFGSQDDYDHIIHCLPQGTGEPGQGWIAYAFTDTPLSFYNDAWCGSLTSVMHEVGHNLGVGHSGEVDEGNYEDRTCIMGVSFLRADGPQECFNGVRNWALDWFVDRQVTVDPKDTTWGGYLAAFVDYEQIIDDDMYVIIKVLTEDDGDLYVQYNRAKKHNWEVEEKANQVTIVKSGVDSGSVSTMLAGIDMNSTSYNYTNAQGDVIVIEVCKEGHDGDVEYMKISVHMSGEKSACGCQDTENSFTILGEERYCTWFVENPTLANLYCEVSHVARRECPVTCDSCGDKVAGPIVRRKEVMNKHNGWS